MGGGTKAHGHTGAKPRVGRGKSTDAACLYPMHWPCVHQTPSDSPRARSAKPACRSCPAVLATLSGPHRTAPAPPAPALWVPPQAPCSSPRKTLACRSALLPSYMSVNHDDVVPAPSGPLQQPKDQTGVPYSAPDSSLSLPGSTCAPTLSWFSFVPQVPCSSPRARPVCCTRCPTARTPFARRRRGRAHRRSSTQCRCVVCGTCVSRGHKRVTCVR